MKQSLPQNSFENMRDTEASMGTREVIMQRISKRAWEDRTPCHSRTIGVVAADPASWQLVACCPSTGRSQRGQALWERLSDSHLQNGNLVIPEQFGPFGFHWYGMTLRTKPLQVSV